MKGITTSWKIFRAFCIVQLVLVAFKGMLSISALFYKTGFVVNFINVIAYGCVFLFVYHGLSMLNYNYPDVPLSPKQKRWFNILYLLNFLLIAFLFAQIVNTWWLGELIVHSNGVANRFWFMLTTQFLFAWVIFIIHLLVLGGMFQLRRLIYQNTISTWYQQFEKKE
jgi:hypothetical protein